MKKWMSRLVILLALFSAGTVLADGGTWKMGPFGPYWEDNDWPEFTPMYWMEEFMNRMDDDDDEIREWMLNNQYGGQRPGAIGPGTYPGSGWSAPGTAPLGGGPQYGWTPNPWSNPWANPWSNPYAAPYSAVPGNDWAVSPYPRADMAPQQYQKREKLPRLTADEFARMPKQLQREYRREYEREYGPGPRKRTSPERYESTLPNLTPEQYARMPRELQRQYKRDFDREYARYRELEARKRNLRRRALPLRNTPR